MVEGSYDPTDFERYCGNIFGTVKSSYYEMDNKGRFGRRGSELKKVVMVAGVVSKYYEEVCGLIKSSSSTAFERLSERLIEIGQEVDRGLHLFVCVSMADEEDTEKEELFVNKHSRITSKIHGIYPVPQK
jgi:hypothetical protein